VLGARHGYGAGEETDPFLCTRPTTLELWLIQPLQGRQSPRNQYACWQACLIPNRDFQQETCNTAAIMLSCAHSWWSRQSQYCPVTRFRDAGMPLFDHCTHFHIPIWLAFRGYSRTICEIGRSGMWGGGENPHWHLCLQGLTRPSALCNLGWHGRL
jgi:hypothetical protein